METAQENQKTTLTRQEEKKDEHHELLKTCLSTAKEFFILSLVFYLILFILETIFPGFVSYNFNLNWVLGVVLFLGLIAAFAPPDSTEATSGREDEKKPKIIDYFTAVFLGVCGSAIIFYKIQLDLPARLIVSAIAGAFVIGLSLVLLTVEDEEVKEKEEEIEPFVQETFLSRKTFIYPLAFFRLLLFKKVNFPLFLILIVFLFSIFSLPEKAGVTPRKFDLSKLSALLKLKTPPSPTLSPTPLISPQPVGEEVKEKVRPSAELMVKVFNGGAREAAESDFAKVLKEAGFVKVFFGTADNSNYENGTLKFRPEDKDQASLIKNLLQNEYSIINEAPSGTTSAEISVILGVKETTELKLE